MTTEEKILTPKFIAVSIIFVALFSIWATFQSGFMAISGLMFSMGQNVVGMPTGALLVLALLFIIRLAAPALKFNVRQLIVLYSMVAISLAHSGYFVPWCHYNGMVGARVYITDFSDWVPSVWSPDASVIEKMYIGGQPVMWAEWAIPVVFWTFFFMVLTILALSITSIMRKRWIEEELLAYPFGQIATVSIQFIATEASESAAQRKRNLFAIAFALVFLFYMPYVLHLGWPAFPDIYGWFSPPFGGFFPGQLDLIAAGVNIPMANIQIQIAPFLWGWFYLLSMDILLTASLTWLIFFIILPPLLYSVGFFGVGVEPSFGLMHQYFKPAVFCYMGMFPAIFIVPLILNWRYLKRTIDSAIKGGTSEDAGELMSYRAAYILFIASFVILIAIAMASGSGFLTAFWWMIMNLMYLFVQGRLRGEIGMGIMHGGTAPGDFHVFFHDVYATGSMEEVLKVGPDYIISPYLNLLTTSDISYGAMVGNEIYTLDALKVAHEHKMSLKGLFVPLVLSSFVALLVSTPIVLWSHYTLGYPRVPIHGDGVWWMNFFRVPGAYNSPNPWEPYGWWPSIIGGFLTATVLYILRMRFAWFPLNPLGIYLGGVGPWFPAGSACIIAYVLKYITLKVGGTRLYEDTGVPLAVGAFMGFTVALLAGGIVSIYRTFVPV